jgi:hypothetical protein
MLKIIEISVITISAVWFFAFLAVEFIAFIEENN